MRNLIRTTWVAIAALVATWQVCATARAQNPDCSSLGGTIIYGAGGSAQRGLIGRVASQLAADTDPVTVVYYSKGGACTAMAALNPDSSEADRKGVVKGTADYWVAGSNSAKSCELPADGQLITFGSMQQGPALCAGVDGLYAGISDVEGPVGTVNFIVPLDSKETSISAEAVHFVFGFGDDSGVDPWVDNDLIFRRNQDSAVQLYVGLAGSIPATKFAGIDATNQDGVINGIYNKGDAAIGIVSGDAYDAARAKVKALAYQHTGQACGYWPDSSSTSFDKANVRDGHYYLWGTTHFYPLVDGGGDISDAPTKRFVDYIIGKTTPAGRTAAIDIQIDAGYVPDCAMHVSRKGDLAPLASYQPDEPCGCYFEARATGDTDCESCDADDGEEDSDCPDSAKVCRHGYCEVK